MSVKPGKRFELDFRGSATRQGVFTFRPKDCPGAWQGGENQTRFTPNNEFDLIIYAMGSVFTLELKSFKGTSFPFSAIRSNQITGLLNAAHYAGVISGVVLNFRKYSRTFFIPIEEFETERKHGPRKSINLERAKSIGFEVDQELLRVNYRYDFIKLARELVLHEWEK